MSAVLASVPIAPRAELDIALRRMARAAVAALHDELTLEPKPGLVSPRDSGSHSDMDAATLIRSLFALRHAYRRLAALGAAGAGFDALAASGRVAEARMLRATGGVNTHRGAIFCLGLLCASGGALLAQGRPLQPAALRQMLLRRWGAALVARESVESRFKAAMAPVASSVGLGRAAATPSHGRAAAQAHGLRGANAEAAAEAALLKAAALAPDSPDVELEAGNIALAKGDTALAREAWEAAASDGPDTPAGAAASAALGRMGPAAQKLLAPAADEGPLSDNAAQKPLTDSALPATPR